MLPLFLQVPQVMLQVRAGRKEQISFLLQFNHKLSPNYRAERGRAAQWSPRSRSSWTLTCAFTFRLFAIMDYDSQCASSPTACGGRRSCSRCFCSEFAYDCTQIGHARKHGVDFLFFCAGMNVLPPALAMIGGALVARYSPARHSSSLKLSIEKMLAVAT